MQAVHKIRHFLTSSAGMANSLTWMIVAYIYTGQLVLAGSTPVKNWRIFWSKIIPTDSQQCNRIQEMMLHQQRYLYLATSNGNKLEQPQQKLLLF